jgi:hypothetical protein
MHTWTGPVVAILLVGTVSFASCSADDNNVGMREEPSTSADPNLATAVEGSPNFQISGVAWDQGSISATIEYVGTCDLVQADLRFTYTKGETVQTGEQIDGIDTHFPVGPLAPNEPYSNSYLGEDKFSPDGITFVFSNEACV